MPRTQLQEFNELLDRIGEARALEGLGVHRTTLMRWARGQVAIPPPAMYVMRSLAWSPGIDPAWENWAFHRGHLYAPNGDSFTPGELEALRYERLTADALRRELAEVRAKLAQVVRDAAERDRAANDMLVDRVRAG